MTDTRRRIHSSTLVRSALRTRGGARPGRMQRNNCREEERKRIFSVPTKPWPGRAKIHIELVYVAYSHSRLPRVRSHSAPHFFHSLFLSSLLSFWLFSVSISSCWMVLDSRTNSTPRSETAEIPQRESNGFLFNSQQKDAGKWLRRWLRNTQWASLFVTVDLISFCHYCYEKFL